MIEDKQSLLFLSNYNEDVQQAAEQLRNLIAANLPDIIEQVDLPAKMIGYCYGQKYIDLICTIIPSKKGLKLGFNRGTEVNDPHKLLQGSGKISRYVVIDVSTPVSTDLESLLKEALELYQQKKQNTFK